MKFLLTLFLTINSILVFGQDPHFTNYTNMPLQLNSALTGQIADYASRFNIGYREQWQTFPNAGAFSTLYASVDRRFCLPTKGDYWALGVQVLADQRGKIPLQRLDALLSGAYFKNLTDVRKNYQIRLGVGVEAGMASYRLGRSNLLFDENFDNPTATNVSINDYNFMLPDFGSGLVLSMNGKNRTDWSFQIGAAAKHLNTPEFKFSEQENTTNARLNSLYNFHFTAVFPLNKRLALAWENVYTYQKPTTKFLSQLDLITVFNKSSLGSIGFGARIVDSVNGRLLDVAFTTARLEYMNFNFSFTYERNFSELQRGTKNLAAVELTVGWLFGESDCSRVFCPRYSWR